MKQTINKIMQKNMSRKDFLAHMGALMLSVIGIAAIVRSLENFASPTTAGGNKNSSQGFAYGQSAYGGKISPN